MNYDFDKVIQRRNTQSLKWDILQENELPMWVADMDFEAAPAIQSALKKRLESSVFGYQILPEKWYDAYRSWWERRHGITLEKDWLLFSTGVIPSLSAISYQEKHADDPPYIKGDVNSDGIFSVSDVVLLQKWLLAVPDTHLVCWKKADFYKDGRLNVFDLCLMKRALIKNNQS